MGIKYYVKIGSKYMKVAGSTRKKDINYAATAKILTKPILTTKKRKLGSIVECWFDGSCGPTNPGGIMGCGCIIKQGNKYLLKEGFRLSSDGYTVTTNNISEHFALQNILKKLIELGLQKEKIVVYGDSNLVIQQMLGNWRIKSGYYKDTAVESRLLLFNFTDIDFKWIPREQNGNANELSIKYAPKFNEFL